jgi:VWFA-related protein
VAATFQLLRIAVLVLSLALAQTPPAQTPPAQPPAAQPAATQPPPDIVFHSTTRLVQVNVVAHDKDGKPVADLKKEDFSLTEKGKPQEISFFSVESLDKLPAAPPKLPPHIFSNSLAQREGVPPSVTVILLDSLNTNFVDQNYARTAVIDFLLQVKPTDHIAIYRLSGKLQVLHDYTTDAADLIKRLQESRSEMFPDGAAASGFDLSPILGMGGGGRGNQASFIMNDRILNTLAAMEAIAHNLAGVPGRKNLVWVSDGIPLAIGTVMGPPSQIQRTYTEEVQRTERALNDSDVSVYAVDARGLTPPRSSSVASSSPSMGSGMGNNGRNTRPSMPRASSTPISTRFDSMIELADRTGGRAYHNTNDLKSAIRDAIGDSEITYTLGYHPTNTEMDGKFRDIKVKVDRSGVNVRYRKGYLATSAANMDPKVRQEEMANAVWSPLDATAVPMNARVDLVEQPKPNSVHVVVQVDPRSVTLEEKDGRYVGKVDITMTQKDDRGNLVGPGTTDTLDLNLKPETYAKIMHDGLVYQKTFLREANASTLRMVVRDNATSAIGSLTVAYKDLN